MEFVYWYYTKGVRGFFRVWENLLYFYLRFFSVKRLFLTLFSYWKKDLVPRDWRGWRPVKATQVFLVNQMFRVFGAIVRSVIIFIALLMESLTLALGIVLLVVWALFPLLAATSIIGIFLGAPILIIAVIGLGVFFAIAYRAFIHSQKVPYSDMPLQMLSKQEWFERVLMRTGLTVDELTDENVNDEKKFQKLLKTHDLTAEEFNESLRWEIHLQEKEEHEKEFWTRESLLSIPPIGKQWTYGYTVNLDEYAIELSSHDPTEYKDTELIGYEEEIEMVRLALERKDQNNVLLIGDAGIGKKSAVHYLAKLIRQGRIEGMLDEVRFMLVDLSEAVSSATDKGDNPEHVLHTLFKEATYAGNIVLIIENIGKYLGSAKASSVNIAAVIDEYLALPTFRILATSTKGEYHRIIEKHDNVMKNFEVVEVKEPSEQEALRILLQKFESEEKQQIIFSYQSLREIIKKSSQLGKIIPLPERAIDLAYEVLLYWKKDPAGVIDPDIVYKVISLKTGVTHGIVNDEERTKLLNLEKILHRRVIGQNGAIDQISDVIRKMRAGIGNEKKPIGSFLFLGPTGVGKTETAKALAEAHFGNENRMIRFDMSEYQTQEGFGRLIGSEGTGSPGILTSKIKDNPFSLILLDELEKAYSGVLDLFLQVLDEGMITDAFGEKVSFRGAIIIATSNAGAQLIKELVEKNTPADEISRKLIDHIVQEGIFRVEFLNRFDDVIFFKVLNDQQLEEVVALMLRRFALRLGKEKNIIVEFGQGVIRKIIQRGYDPVFGARSVARYIADSIEDIIAKKIIGGEVKKGEKLIMTKEDVI